MESGGFCLIRDEVSPIRPGSLTWPRRGGEPPWPGPGLRGGGRWRRKPDAGLESEPLAER
ncbi:hypothetical protein KIL84_011689, partial [Mauremys mutica]